MMTLTELERELDKTKIKIFIGSTAALLGSVMCSVDIMFDNRVKTAQIGKRLIRWNPEFFEKLTPAGRVSVLLHELWHIVRLHRLRRGNRLPGRWNAACDYVINEWLFKEGYSLDISDVYVNPYLDPQYFGMSEEQIYDLLPDIFECLKTDSSGMEDMPPSDDPDEPNTDLPIVIRAIEAAHQSGCYSLVPTDVIKAVDSYLNPVVPWESLLMHFFQDLSETRHTMRRPNRRNQDFYMSTRYKDEGRLDKLNYYLDISGSVTEQDVLRFNSEFKFVKSIYNPREMVQVLFNTKIIQETVITEHDPFEDTIYKTGGATSLFHVRQHIIDTRPTCAIVFSDLECSPMAHLPFNIPVIWVVVGSRKTPVLFGTPIYIDL